jgi:methylenetetrahydrofolate--tRNA-(uracil-5-)-methyltransferase
LHRNTFLNSPKLLDGHLRLRTQQRLRFAGQITGVEGYIESAAIGLLSGRFAAAERRGVRPTPPPITTALGALLSHITGGHIEAMDTGPRSFQPMNINFGLFPAVEEPTHDAAGRRLKGKEKSIARRQRIAARALTDLAAWLDRTTRFAA